MLSVKTVRIHLWFVSSTVYKTQTVHEGQNNALHSNKTRKIDLYNYVHKERDYKRLLAYECEVETQQSNPLKGKFSILQYKEDQWAFHLSNVM